MIVQVKNLIKRYGDKLAVDNMNLAISQGEILGLLGPNGAGKTTLINSIIGITEIQSGEVNIFGKSMKKEPLEILLLTTFKDSEYTRSAVKYGAEGYMLKSNSSESIIDGIRAVCRGNVVYGKEVAGLLSGMVEMEKKLSWESLNITQKEYEIMELISMGLSNREISEKLYMGEGTLRNNISVLLDKLDLRDRTQLAIFFIRKLEK